MFFLSSCALHYRLYIQLHHHIEEEEKQPVTRTRMQTSHRCCDKHVGEVASRRRAKIPTPRLICLQTICHLLSLYRHFHPSPHTTVPSTTQEHVHTFAARSHLKKRRSKKKNSCALFVCVYVRAGLFLAPRVHLSPLRQDNDVAMCFLSAPITLLAIRM